MGVKGLKKFITHNIIVVVVVVIVDSTCIIVSEDEKRCDTQNTIDGISSWSSSNNFYDGNHAHKGWTVSEQQKSSQLATHRSHPSCVHSVSCYYQNVRGMRTKLDELRKYISLSHFQIIIFSETGLTADICDAKLGMLDFDIYWLDRNKNTRSYCRGGGVFIAVKKYLRSSLIFSPFNTVEHLFVKLKIDNNKVYLFAVFYIPPNSMEKI